MILKGSQRANGGDLAVHLMNEFDNERIELAQVRGSVADDLYGAFAEFEAIAAGTKAQKPLYSLSINPPRPLTREQYAQAIERIEERLGLKNQPRAVVFHVKADKDGVSREHCHVVWSRIDAAKMQAIHMAHDHRKLCDLACELANKFGLELPPGLKAWEKKQRFEKDALEPSLAEKAQQAAGGLSPEQRRAEITAIYERSDGPAAFQTALEQKGYVLAAGARRGFVLVDQSGNVHSLSRYVAGHNAKAIAARLAPLTPASLPSVDDAKEIVRQRRQAQEERARERQRQEPPASEKARAELAARHAARRAKHIAREQQLLTRQQHERLSLDAAQQSERQGIVFRARSAVADFIRGTPGLRSVLGPIQKLTGIDPRQRQRLESDALTRRHKRERADVERRKRALSKIEARESQSLLKMLRRRQEESLRAVWDAHAHEVSDHTARHGAGDGGGAEAIRGGRQFDDGDLREEFSASAGHDHHPGDDGGGGDDDRARRWNSRAKTRTPGRRRRRGKGYGYRPGED